MWTLACTAIQDLLQHLSQREHFALTLQSQQILFDVDVVTFIPSTTRMVNILFDSDSFSTLALYKFAFTYLLTNSC